MSSEKPLKKEKKMSFRLLSVLFAAVVALFVMFITFSIERGVTLSDAPLEFNRVVFSELQGNVEVKRKNGGNWGAAKKGDMVMPGDFVRTGDDGGVELKVLQQGIVRLDRNAQIMMLFEEGNSLEAVVQVGKGRVWVNTVFSPLKLNVFSPGLALIPQRSVFHADYNPDEVSVFSHEGHTTVGILDKKAQVTRTLGPDDDKMFLNSFLLAQDHEVKIVLDKLTEKLRPLLYTKLVKEFLYGFVGDTRFTDDAWVTWNIERDAALKSEIVNRSIETIKKRGLHFKSLVDEGGVLDSVRGAFVLSDRKKAEDALEMVFKNLEDAEYYLVTGDSNSAEIRLNRFKRAVNEYYRLNVKYRSFLAEKIDRKLNAVAVLEPVHFLYPVKMAVADVYFETLSSAQNMVGPFLYLRGELTDAFRVVEDDADRALALFESYDAHLSIVIGRFKEQFAQHLYLLEEENQIISQVIGKYPSLYRDEVFAVKSLLEDEWLAFVDDPVDLREEKQTLIVQKVDLLKKLRKFFFAEKIQVAEAKAVVARLLSEIERLQDASSQTAVQKLFAQQLKDFSLFNRYLNSPEYSSPTAGLVYGKTHKDRFDRFLKALDEASTIEGLRETILGADDGGADQLSAQTIMNEAMDALRGVGIENVQMTSPALSDWQYVGITSASINGTIFSGRYDWRRGIVSSITVEGEVVSKSGVRLNQLSDFFLKRFGSPAAEADVPTSELTKEVEKESSVVKATKVLISQKLRRQGVMASPSQIAVKDLEASEFVLTGVVVQQSPRVTCNFVYKSTENVAEAVAIVTEEGNIRLDRVALDGNNFNEYVVAAYDAFLEEREAAREKAKEEARLAEEMKEKLLEEGVKDELEVSGGGA